MYDNYPLVAYVLIKLYLKQKTNYEKASDCCNNCTNF